MEQQILANSTKRYRVLIDSLATEGRVFSRDDVLGPDDAPGEIESMLHAGVIQEVSATKT
jgi:hypothetical protein